MVQHQAWRVVADGYHGFYHQNALERPAVDRHDVDSTCRSCFLPSRCGRSRLDNSVCLNLRTVVRRCAGDAAKSIFCTFRTRHLRRFLPGLEKPDMAARTTTASRFGARGCCGGSGKAALSEPEGMR
jgi:hypothetical protein